jgi:hypothetical protein
MPLVLVGRPAAAQSLADYDYDNLSFRGIGFDWGVIFPSKVDATPAYSLRLDLGFLGPAVRILPSLTYWDSELKDRELDRLAEQLGRLPSLQNLDPPITGRSFGTVRWSDLSLGLDAQLVWTAPLDVITYVGAGVGLHTLNGRGDFIDDTFVEDLLDSTTAGVAASAGVELQLMPRLRAYGEARYTVASDVRYPGIRVGAAFMFPVATTPPAGTPSGNR